MPEIKIKDIDSQRGSIPSVFKLLDPSDVTVTPFTINKTWTVVSGSATSSCLPLTAIYYDYEVLPILGSSLVYNDAKNIDGSLQTVTYYSINQLFYKNKRNLAFVQGSTNSQLKRFLHISASILSFPYVKIGEGIKPKSFIFETTSGSISYTINSDEYGNLYDANLNSNRIISDTKFYEGFNEYFDLTRISRSSTVSDYLKFNDRYITGSVTFVPGVTTTSPSSKSFGYCGNFDGTGFIVAKNENILGSYDRENNYAIAFYISGSSVGSTPQTIVSKINKQSPYDIWLMSNKKIGFYIHGNTYDNQSLPPTDALLVTSSAAVSSSWNHVVCQKSGSYMQIYVNGSLQTNIHQSALLKPNSPFSQSIKINCNADTFIGGRSMNNTSYNYNGKLDEVRIYNKALSSTEIGYLADRSETGSLLQTNIVGNIFYKHGISVISSANPIYDNLLQTPYTVTYKSTLTRYELSTFIRINADEFNLSLNQSLLNDDSLTYQTFVTSSVFNPYITTIGLYDNDARLLAIGKLASPIKKREDVDLSILVRIDLDKNIK